MAAVTPTDRLFIGIHTRDNDRVVNPLKAKQLTNIRAAGTDENLVISPPIRMSLEQALEFIDDDELVEATSWTSPLPKGRFSTTLPFDGTWQWMPQ